MKASSFHNNLREMFSPTEPWRQRALCPRNIRIQRSFEMCPQMMMASNPRCGEAWDADSAWARAIA